MQVPEKSERLKELNTFQTWSPALGPSVWNSMGRHLLSSFIKLEFWKCAMSAAFPWMRAYARVATFSLLNFSHFLPSNVCRRQFALLVSIYKKYMSPETSIHTTNLMECNNLTRINHIDECIAHVAFILPNNIIKIQTITKYFIFLLLK